jgi:hypothetical protein
MDDGWAGEEHAGEVERSEDHVWECNVAGARHVHFALARA